MPDVIRWWWICQWKSCNSEKTIRRTQNPWTRLRIPLNEMQSDCPKTKSRNCRFSRNKTLIYLMNTRSIIGNDTACASSIVEKANEDVNLNKKLADLSKVSPQSVYNAYSQRVQNKITFITKTITDNEFFPAGDRKSYQRWIVTESVWQKRYWLEASKSTFITNQRRWSKYLVVWLSNTWICPLENNHRYISWKRCHNSFKRSNCHTAVNSKNKKIVENEAKTSDEWIG